MRSKGRIDVPGIKGRINRQPLAVIGLIDVARGDFLKHQVDGLGVAAGVHRRRDLQGRFLPVVLPRPRTRHRRRFGRFREQGFDLGCHLIRRGAGARHRGFPGRLFARRSHVAKSKAEDPKLLGLVVVREYAVDEGEGEIRELQII